MPPPPVPPPAADGLTAEEADGLRDLLAALVLGREQASAPDPAAVCAAVDGACQRADEPARQQAIATVVTACTGTGKPALSSLSAGLTDLIDERFPTDEALGRLLSELGLWVWWYRLPAYVLSYAVQCVTLRRRSNLYPVACLQYGQSQISLAQDLALHSIENAYRGVARAAREPGMEAYAEPAEMIAAVLRSIWRFYRRWSVDLPFTASNPLVDHLYWELTLGRLADAFPDAEVRRLPAARDALPAIVDACSGPELTYWRVIALRLLATCDPDDPGASGHLQRALADAEAAGLDAEIGHLRRLSGYTLRRAGELADAETMFIAAAGHEQSGLLRYWNALADLELGDLRLAVAAQRGSDPQDPAFAGAITAYRFGRNRLAAHLAASTVPIDRAVKVELTRASCANALEAATLAGATADILAQAELNGPREATELLADVAGAAELTDPVKSAAYRAAVPGFLRHLGSAPGDVEAYLVSVVDENEQRQLYFRTRNRLAARRDALGPAAVATELGALRRPGQIAIVVEPQVRRGLILCLDLETGLVGPFQCDLSHDRVRALHARFTDTLAGLARHPQPWLGVGAAVRDLLDGYQASIGPWLDQLAPFLEGRSVTFFPRRQVAAVPLHALTAGGRTLTEICPVGYGQTFAGFLELLGRSGAGSGSGSGSEVTMVYDDRGARAFAPLAAAFPAAPGRTVTVLTNPTLDVLAERVGSAPPEPAPTRDLFFACHGVFSPDDPVASRLLLDRQETVILLADVLARLDLRGWRSVVLGACETGQARSEITSEYLGLTGAFLAAGASYVVGSLWKAHPLATCLLFERYFARLNVDGQGPRQALRLAQLDLIALSRDQLKTWIAEHLPQVAPETLAADLAERPFADPAFWAAFSVSGAL